MSALVETFSAGLILPALLIAGMGWMVPWALSQVFPEGVRPLMVLAFVATLIMFVAATLIFLLIYVGQGIPLSALFADGVWAGLGYFGRLGLASSLLWLPLLLLSVANRPRYWTKETW